MWTPVLDFMRSLSFRLLGATAHVLAVPTADASCSICFSTSSEFESCMFNGGSMSCNCYCCDYGSGCAGYNNCTCCDSSGCYSGVSGSCSAQNC